MDGGDIELISTQDGIVKVFLKGACSGCPSSQMTLKNGIEVLLKEKMPGKIKEVIAINTWFIEYEKNTKNTGVSL